MKRKVGRPSSRKKISVEQAVQLTKEYWAQYGRDGYSKGHIYNLIYKKELERTGPKNCALLFEDEVKEKLCG